MSGARVQLNVQPFGGSGATGTSRRRGRGQGCTSVSGVPALSSSIMSSSATMSAFLVALKAEQRAGMRRGGGAGDAGTARERLLRQVEGEAAGEGEGGLEKRRKVKLSLALVVPSALLRRQRAARPEHRGSEYVVDAV